MSENEYERRHKRHNKDPQNEHRVKRKLRKKAAAQATHAAPQPNRARVGMHDPWSGDDTRYSADERRFDPWSSYEEEHEEVHEEVHEENDPILSGIAAADNLQLAYEAVTDGSVLVKDLPQHAAKVLAGKATLAEAASTYAGVLINPFVIGAGIHEMAEGAKEYDHDTAGGAMTMGQGALGVASGVGGLLGSAGMVNPAWGLGASSAQAGLQIGRYSDQRAKELGVFHDEDGNAETASKWAADVGMDAEEWMFRHTGNETLAGGAGGTATLAVAAVGATGAVGAVAADFGSALGARVARHHRAASYAGLSAKGEAPVIDQIGTTDPKTGQVTFETADTAGRLRAGEQMALEDERREEAIERSKLLFPERWGLPPNPVSIVHQTALAARRGGSK